MDQLEIYQVNDKRIPFPSRANSHAAGLDLAAPDTLTLHPRDAIEIELGFCVRIPEGHYGRLAIRSSLAQKGLIAAGGTIGAGDLTPLTVVLIHCGSLDPVIINKGDRIVQLICVKCTIPTPTVAVLDKWQEQTSNSERKERGFGSTGF